jgi:excinuclease UvrABC nuclease subunit
MSSTDVEDLAGVFRPTDNILAVNLHWMYQPSTEEVLPIFKKWRNLNRLKLKVNEAKTRVNFPRMNMIRDFILGMEYLTALHINDYFDHEQLKIFEEKVNDLVKQRRPRFIFKVGSCLDVF